MRRHIILLVGAVALPFAIAVVTVYAADSDIVLSEIMIDAVTDGAGEWVEICNTSTSSVDVTGWQIQDNNSTDTIAASMCPSNDCSIPGRTCWLIATTQTNLSTEFGSGSGNYATCGASVDASKTIFLGGNIGNGLANDNDRVILREDSVNHDTVDCYSWDGTSICQGGTLTYVSGGDGIDDNDDGSETQPVTNVQGDWADGDGCGTPYDIDNTQTGGSPTGIVLSDLRGRSHGLMSLPVYVGMVVAIATIAGLFTYHRRPT